MILEQCKGVHCVDLGESFQTHIYLQNLASIQPRTSPVKFAGGPVRRASGSPGGVAGDRGERPAARLSEVGSDSIAAQLAILGHRRNMMILIDDLR